MILSPSLVPQRPHSDLGITRGLVPIPFVFRSFLPISTQPVSCLQNTSHEPENSRIQLRRGPIVLQKRYEPSTLSDRRRYVDEVDLEPSIVFNMHDPHEEGFPLKAAMKGHFSRLVSRDDLMFQGWSSSVSIRINVSFAHHRPALSPICK